MIRGVIFDFDGLILETEGPDFRSWQECYTQHGCELAFEPWAALIGHVDSAWDPYAHLEALSGRPIDRELVRSQRRQRYLELVEAELTRPGVEAYLREARKLGLKLGVASSGTGEWVTGHLARLDLTRHFETIRYREHVERAKPSPDLYQLALADLGLLPHEAVAIEDSPPGVRAAKAAGIYCLAVPNPLTARLDLTHADAHVASLAELPLRELLARAAEHHRERQQR